MEVVSRVALSKIYNRAFDSSLIVDNKYFTSSGLKPNASGMVWGKQFTTDTNGCRTKSYKQNRTSTLKWLFIGDSVTEGVGVEDSSTFVPLSLGSWNCYNYSLIGYSTADYLNIIRAIVPNDTDAKKVTVFYCLNDVYSNSPKVNLPAIGKASITGKINALLQDRYFTYKLLKLFLFQNSDRYFRYDAQFYSTENPMFISSMNDLKTCDSLCKSYNTIFDVVVLPYRSQLIGVNISNRKPQNAMGSFCNQAGIEFHDASAYLSKLKNPEKLYLFGDEIHFSELGHSAMKEYVVRELF
jgi:lysophospholipase L1-like esterase